MAKQKLQLDELFPILDSLQLIHGDKSLNAIYGAGCTYNTDLMFILMNPTGKNLSAQKAWNGLKAPWVGTKNIWKLLFKLDLIDGNYFNKTQTLKLADWDDSFVQDLYSYIADRKLYLTSLAKCTQVDARPLNNSIFRDYLESTFEEISLVNPKAIITFGNQVSTVLLSKPITVSKYLASAHEKLEIKNKVYNIYPTFYPVGQGMRNMPLAIERIKKIIKQ